MARTAVFKRRSKAVSCIGIALFGLTVMGAHQQSQFPSISSWTSVDLPNPPAPLAESPLPYPIEVVKDVTAEDNVALKLQLVAKQDAWLEVETDGHTEYRKMVHADEKLSFGASQRIRITTGNAPGLDLRFNGEKVTVDNAERRVRTIEFTSEGARNLNSGLHVTKS